MQFRDVNRMQTSIGKVFRRKKEWNYRDARKGLKVVAEVQRNTLLDTSLTHFIHNWTTWIKEGAGNRAKAAEFGCFCSSVNGAFAQA